ncbi:hypothetical protein [Micromonospora sp. 067-2]|uniref:hypothetical protein n=1 Tax=Micromonospora sp. 067-2 TaxID=2789270 RepID=UPI00397C6D9F
MLFVVESTLLRCLLSHRRVDDGVSGSVDQSFTSPHLRGALRVASADGHRRTRCGQSARHHRPEAGVAGGDNDVPAGEVDSGEDVIDRGGGSEAGTAWQRLLFLGPGVTGRRRC